MGRLAAVGILRVLNSLFTIPYSLFTFHYSLLPVHYSLLPFNILRHLAAEGYCERLDAAADAEDGQLAVEGQTGDEQFGQVAFGIDAVKKGRRFLATVERIDVGTAAEQQSVDMVECGHQRATVGKRRNHQRCAACGLHLFVIPLGQLAALGVVVGSDTDDRMTLTGRILTVDAVDVLLYGKAVHSFSISSKCTGISRLMFCSREMSVSVATTPGISCS